MRQWLVFLGAALLASAASAQAQTGPYIDPVLRVITKAEVRRNAELQARVQPGVRSDAAVLPVRVGARRGAEGLRITIFAQLRSDAGLDELRALGAEIGSYQDGIATVELALDSVGRLPALRHLVAAEASYEIAVTHDSSARAIKLNEVRTLTGNEWTGATGRGVIVAIYDTGLDYHHLDFRTNNGQTRVLALWDQTQTTSPRTPPTGFTRGHVCTRDAIQRVIDNPQDTSGCPQLDTNGHGTHTAGSAAGDGSATGNGGTAFRYAGVAPNADLMIVKGGNGSFVESDIIDGLRWLEREGASRGRPMVVNLSLGSGVRGPHDGTRLYERAIDELSRPGFVVVVSAGNDGSNGNIRNRDGTPTTLDRVFLHGSGISTAGAAREFTFTIPSFPSVPPVCNESVQFTFWYEAQDSLRITVIRPDGSSHSAETGQATEQASGNGHITIDMNRGISPLNGDREALVAVSDCGTGAPPMPGTYRLRVATLGRGSGQPYHFWLTDNFLGGAPLARGGLGFDNRFLVGSPSTARSAISVAASATRMCWPTATGSQVCFTQIEDIGDIARFSSAGPTRDGRLKPEITAPGMAIVSALSRNATVAANRIVPGGVHWANQGTSMASPHVAGAIALLLEVKPTATHEEIRQVFGRSALRDQFTSRVYSTDLGMLASDWWGFGKLDVAAALCAIGGTAGRSIVSVTPALDTLPQNATLKLEACAPGATVVFVSTRPAVASVDASGTVRALQPGTTLIIASAGTAADTAEITVVPPSVVVARGASVAPAEPALAPAGTRLPLLQMSLQVNGTEAVRIDALTFTLSGLDPNARLVVAQDLNRNGLLEATDRVLAVANRGVKLENDTVRVETPGLTIPQRDSASLIIGVELSGLAPNNTQFQVSFVPQETRTTGVRSGAQNRLEPLTVAIRSAVATTTVLARGVAFSLSENPVRSNRVVFNFRESPTTAAIYTLTGRRVRDLKTAITRTGSVEWNLQNDEGTTVAPGVYLLVFDVGNLQVREKLFVLPPRN